MFSLFIQTLVFIFASAFILQFITKRERKMLVHIVAFVLLAITNYYLVENLISLYREVVAEIAV